MSSRASRSTKRKAEVIPALAVEVAEPTAVARSKRDQSKRQKNDNESASSKQSTKRKPKDDTAPAAAADKQADKTAKKATAAEDKPKHQKSKTAAAAEAATHGIPSKRQAEKPAKVAAAAAAVDKPKAKKAKDAAATAVAAEKAPSKKQAKAKAAKKPERKTAATKAALEQPKQARRSGKKKQQQEVEDKSPHELFMEIIAEKEKALNKHCIILEQFDGDEDEVTIAELQQLKKVFVPEKTWEEFVEVWGELDGVGEDSEDEGEGEEDAAMAAFMKAFMGKFLNTKHGAEMHAILNKYLKAVDKSLKAKAWQDAFCLWAAIVMAARREGHWWEDTDVPDAAAAIYNKLREQWGKLKARSDEELGGLVCEGELSARDELGAYLQGMADEMKQMDYDVADVA